MGTRGREPRASALGWYEIGPWPESEGAFSSAQIGKRGGRYIRIYIVPIYSRCSDALLSRLLKNSVLHPFPFIDFRASENAAAVIEHIDHRKEAGAVGEPGMGRGIQLPELTNAAALPALDRSRWAMVGFGVGEVVFHGPAADLSPIDLEVTFAEHFAGSKAVRSWGLATEPLLQEGVHLGRPSGRMIAARNAGRPSGLLIMSTGRQIVSVKLVKTGSRKAQATGGSLGLEFLGPERRQHMAN